MRIITMEKVRMKLSKSVKNLNTVYYIVLCVLSRLIPHPANMTAMTNLSLYAGARMGKAAALVMTVASLLLSNAYFSMLYHYAFFSITSLFMYSGFIAITLLGKSVTKNATLKSVFPVVLMASVGYWLWTNFGVWLQGSYPMSVSGLMTCFAMALPFLKNALIGDIAWMVVIFGLLDKMLAPRIYSIVDKQSLLAAK